MSQPSVAVVADSTADLPPELAAERQITVVPLTVLMQGRSYLDGVDITPDEFYERLAAPGATATTSQPTPARFAEAYERLLRDHESVISLHISSRMSGTVDAANQGAAAAGAGRVHVVDTEMVSMPLGLLALAAAAMAREGRDAGAILERLGVIRDGMRVFFMVGTLEYLRRGGRIGRANAFVGSVLQVKPVLTFSGGQVAPLERVRTQDRALGRVIQLARHDGGRVCAMVGHAAAPEAAGRIAQALGPQCESLLAAPLGPVVGAHAGPGTVGVACYPADLYPLGLGRLTSLVST